MGSLPGIRRSLETAPLIRPAHPPRSSASSSDPRPAGEFQRRHRAGQAAGPAARNRYAEENLRGQYGAVVAGQPGWIVHYAELRKLLVKHACG
jgi:hypothetical protein